VYLDDYSSLQLIVTPHFTRLIAKEDTSFDYGKSFHWLKDDKDKALKGVSLAGASNSAVINKLRAP
jgi:hypothetical protein